MASEHESNLKESAHGLADFNAQWTQLASFNHVNTPGAIDVNVDGSVLEGKLSLRGWVSVSLLNWLEVLILPVAINTTSKKIGVWIKALIICSEVVLIFINLPSDLAWNATVILGLVLVTRT